MKIHDEINRSEDTTDFWIYPSDFSKRLKTFCKNSRALTKKRGEASIKQIDNEIREIYTQVKNGEHIFSEVEHFFKTIDIKMDTSHFTDTHQELMDKIDEKTDLALMLLFLRKPLQKIPKALVKYFYFISNFASPCESNEYPVISYDFSQKHVLSFLNTLREPYNGDVISSTANDLLAGLDFLLHLQRKIADEEQDHPSTPINMMSDYQKSRHEIRMTIETLKENLKKSNCCSEDDNAYIHPLVLMKEAFNTISNIKNIEKSIIYKHKKSFFLWDLIKRIFLKTQSAKFFEHAKEKINKIDIKNNKNDIDLNENTVNVSATRPVLS